MSAAKHTPGPWKVCEHSWSDTSILADGFDHAICCLDINHATEESQAADEALMAANARLIAAAPELLALLIEATDDYAEHCEGGEADEWVQAARAAIAKATGSAA